MSERFEFIDRRVLGAFRVVNVAGRRPIGRTLHVFSDTLRFTRNRRELHVITGAPGFGEYTGVFDTAALPAVVPQAFTAWVEDPAGEYQARAFSMTLPRDPAPLASGAQPAAGTLFAIEEIEMLPTPGAGTASSDAVLRIRALRAADRAAFANLLIRADGAGGITGWGMTDTNGEALVAVPGLPRFSEAAGTLTDKTALTLTFITMPPVPQTPPGSLSSAATPLPGTFQNWRNSASTPGRPATLEDGQPPVVNAAPGRELRLTVLVTP